ncbi:protein-disulfide reductase DsbD domain-containing protein [Rubritalea spongiae]
MPDVRKCIAIAIAALCLGTVVRASESCCGVSDGVSVLSNETLSIQFVCDHSEVVTGQSMRVGFRVRHREGFHTYWKQPGIVGYPMQFSILQPELEEAPEVDWDFPERVSMNGHPAHGFKRDVVHSFELHVPENFKSDVFSVEVDVAWMACSKNCFPQRHKFRLELPVGAKGVKSEWFEQLQTREVAELVAWEVSAMRKGDWYEVLLKPQGEKKELGGVYLYSEDGQLTSSFVQQVQQLENGSVRIRAEASEHVELAASLPCLLYAERGLGGEQYVRINPSLEVKE